MGSPHQHKIYFQIFKVLMLMLKLFWYILYFPPRQYKGVHLFATNVFYLRSTHLIVYKATLVNEKTYTKYKEHKY